jgi:hypothetical protein
MLNEGKVEGCAVRDGQIGLTDYSRNIWYIAASLPRIDWNLSGSACR